jgi:sporulation protein YlmC with PRC-barrel domain
MMGNKIVVTTFLALGLFATAAQAGEGAKGAGVHRASNLEGMYVKNGTGNDAQTLGHIEDLVINLRNGRVMYYALGHGQTFGLGGKVFAIAPESLRMADNGEFFILTGVTNQDLDGAQGFDTNKWPTEPDMTWSKDKSKVGKEVKKTVEEGKEVVQGKPILARLNRILGSDVRTPQNERLGTIYDLAVRFMSANHHQVVYAAVSHGGALGVGGKLYAVPADKLHTTAPDLSPNQRALVLHVSEEQFKQLEGFTSGDTWPAQPNQAFWSKVQGGKADGQ